MADWREHDGPAGSSPRAQPGATAAAAVGRFLDLSPDIRGCAILGPSGVLAASGEAERWRDPAAALLAAADSAANGQAGHAHVATEEGEAYAVRLAGLAMVAVTDRFSLASLVLADMRATLREVQAAAVAVAGVAEAA